MILQKSQTQAPESEVQPADRDQQVSSTYQIFTAKFIDHYWFRKKLEVSHDVFSRKNEVHIHKVHVEVAK